MANSPGRTSTTVAGTGIGGASEKVRRRSISSVGSPKLTSLDAGSNTAPFAPHSVRYPIPDSTTYEFGALPGTEFPLAEAQHNVCELFTNRNCVSVRLNTLSGSKSAARIVPRGPGPIPPGPGVDNQPLLSKIMKPRRFKVPSLSLVSMTLTVTSRTPVTSL